MIYRILADLIVILHLLFIAFALLGGLSVIWRRYLIFVHLPAAIWVSLISFKGWICPLTPLENHLRNAAGSKGYTEGFVEHYVIPIVYPVNLTSDIQMVFGVIALVINIFIYALVSHRRLKKKIRKSL